MRTDQYSRAPTISRMCVLTSPILAEDFSGDGHTLVRSVAKTRRLRPPGRSQHRASLRGPAPQGGRFGSAALRIAPVGGVFFEGAPHQLITTNLKLILSLAMALSLPIYSRRVSITRRSSTLPSGSSNAGATPRLQCRPLPKKQAWDSCDPVVFNSSSRPPRHHDLGKCRGAER